MDNIDSVVSRNDSLIESYIEQYSRDKKPIEVSFKSKLKHLNNSDRYTHLIHTYPAKLLMHIPYFFINNTFFSKKGDNVLDPFCGTGTVLLESIIGGREALGADANPLARLIAQVKVEKQDTRKLQLSLTRLIQRSKKYSDAPIPDVVNIDHWFPKKTQRNLAALLKSIKAIRDEKTQAFFMVCFSNCVKKVSYADPRVAVPVRLNPERFNNDPVRYKEAKRYLQNIKTIDVCEKFKAIATQNIERLDSFNNKSFDGTAKVISKDARRLTTHIGSTTKLKKESIQLIITSPPYAGAQKYIRSSSLNLNWTELAGSMDLLELDRKNIGRENFRSAELNFKLTGIKKADVLIKQIAKLDVVRAKIISQYLLEMKNAIDEAIRVLKKGGYFVLIVGNNKVCNKEFNTQEYLTSYIVGKKLKLVFKLIDDIKSYGLMTKRNKTADIISREWVLVFKK
jgi:tRNA G10  N-methylase Trm11